MASYSRLTNNAKKWAGFFEQRLDSVSANSDVFALALSRIYQNLKDILISELDKAIDAAPEYSYEPMNDRLHTAFSKDGIIAVTESGIVYIKAEEYAGSRQDFWDGIRAARLLVSKGRGTNRAKRAAYWQMIYGAYMAGDSGVYDKTISARLSAWKDLAPYWLYLNHGNSNSKYAFPVNRPTRFVEKAEKKCTKLLASEVIRVLDEERRLIADNLNQFYVNTDKFDPSTRLRTFYDSGRRYRIYVTKTKRIGVSQI